MILNIRGKLLEKLDPWAHRNKTMNKLDWRICDAYDFYMSHGEVGRRFWPLTPWRYP